jgi:hypothetical protein
MDEWRQLRAAEKAEAEMDIESMLVTIEQERREPDRWERSCLVEAIGCLYKGAYNNASVETYLALTPVDQRSPRATAKQERNEFLGRCDIRLLREAFRVAQAEPLAQFAVLGPIIFTNAQEA